MCTKFEYNFTTLYSWRWKAEEKDANGENYWKIIYSDLYSFFWTIKLVLHFQISMEIVVEEMLLISANFQWEFQKPDVILKESSN